MPSGGNYDPTGNREYMKLERMFFPRFREESGRTYYTQEEWAELQREKSKKVSDGGSET